MTHHPMKGQRSVEQDAIALMIRELVKHGEINASGKSPEQLHEAFVVWWAKHRDLPLLFVMDYRRGVLAAARSAKRQGDFLLSCLLYATWAEQWVNMAVDHYARLKKVGREVVPEIIRETTLNGKVRWLLPILGAPPISSRHAAAIGQISESRNWFVHYKWKDSENEYPPEEKNAQRRAELFDNTVKYLQRYESHHIERGSHQLARRASRASS